jgi:hypothetical protein
MAMSVQCLRESQALHIDYYSTNKKTANLPDEGCAEIGRARGAARSFRSTTGDLARRALDLLAVFIAFSRQ